MRAGAGVGAVAPVVWIYLDFDLSAFLTSYSGKKQIHLEGAVSRGLVDRHKENTIAEINDLLNTGPYTEKNLETRHKIFNERIDQLRVFLNVHKEHLTILTMNSKSNVTHLLAAYGLPPTPIISVLDYDIDKADWVEGQPHPFLFIDDSKVEIEYMEEMIKQQGEGKDGNINLMKSETILIHRPKSAKLADGSRSDTDINHYGMFSDMNGDITARVAEGLLRIKSNLLAAPR